MALLWSWKWWVLAAVVVGTATAFVRASLQPAQYRAEAVIAVVPARVPETLVPTLTARLQDRLPAIQQQVLSRTRLERVIVDLDLFTEERRTGVMEEIVERLRNSIEVNVIRDGAFRVSYIGGDPRTAMRVADRVSSLLMEESARDREVLVEGTHQFLETTLEELGGRTVEHQKRVAQAERQGSSNLEILRLEHEVLRNQYRSLFAKHQDANISGNLERRQSGQQFKLLDQARLPTRPYSPNRRRMTIAGALVGLGVGLGLVLAILVRQRISAESQ